MKKIGKYFLLLCLFVAASLTLNAQYSTGIGATFGLYGRGATVLQYFDPGSRGAADFLITSQYKGFVVTGLYEVHNKNHNERIELANVGFFFGLGGHGGVVRRLQYKTDPPTDLDKEKIFVIGFDAIVGVEWKIPHVPLLLSVNAKPYLDVNYIKIQPDWFDASVTLRLLF